MKKNDIIFLLLIAALCLPFVVSDSLYAGYPSFSTSHGMMMSFIKFGVLATLGEMLGLRLSTGVYSTHLPAPRRHARTVCRFARCGARCPIRH